MSGMACQAVPLALGLSPCFDSGSRRVVVLCVSVKLKTEHRVQVSMQLLRLWIAGVITMLGDLKNQVCHGDAAST